MGRIAYDEFSMFAENIAEYGLTASATPVVSRVTTTLANGRTVSALKWGSEAPQMVLVHGTAQNAHTWDTVALALGVPLHRVNFAREYREQVFADFLAEQEAFVNGILLIETA